MGGRGSKLEVGNYLNRDSKARTSEYRCIYQEDNIEFLVQNSTNPISAPVFSNTENRIYVTLNRNGEIYELSKYGPNHEKEFSISPGHANEPFLHEHGPHPLRKKLIGLDIPTKHLELYNRVVKIHEERLKGSIL